MALISLSSRDKVIVSIDNHLSHELYFKRGRSPWVKTNLIALSMFLITSTVGKVRGKKPDYLITFFCADFVHDKPNSTFKHVYAKLSIGHFQLVT